MVSVEKALRDAITLYRDNPSFFVPHLVEMALDFLVIITMAVTIVLAIGVHLKDLRVDDPVILLNAISGVGFGLISIILLTGIFGLFLILIIKAGALAWVVGMTRRGRADGKTSLSAAFEDVKRHSFNIFLFWMIQLAILTALFITAVLPAMVVAGIGLPETMAIGLTLLAMMIAFILALALILGLLFAPQFIVAHDMGVIASIRMSLDFVKSNIGAVAIYITIIFVTVFFLSVFNVISSFIPDIVRGASYFLGVTLGIFLFTIRLAVGLVMAPYFEMTKALLIIDAGDNTPAPQPDNYKTQ